MLEVQLRVSLPRNSESLGPISRRAGWRRIYPLRPSHIFNESMLTLFQGLGIDQARRKLPLKPKISHPTKDLADVSDLRHTHFPSPADIKLPEIDIQGATLAMGISKVIHGM